ncbi:hypothetical protein IV203_005006 [Nitzschia inconspicua]|uniref:Uncharacterized protein n=1 Tax=Nitzschia inconspicua TaxID=303405 RepID=A0A9K3KMP3_9STRA|nr:hypothetical protein IV203_005006 [Nitzschia inconspicua]
MICAQVSPCPCTEFSDPGFGVNITWTFNSLAITYRIFLRIRRIEVMIVVVDQSSFTSHLYKPFGAPTHHSFFARISILRFHDLPLAAAFPLQCSLFCLLSKLYLRVIERALVTSFGWFFIGPLHVLRISD